MINEKRDRATLLAILILVSIGLYLTTLSSGFVSDDLFQVLKNEWIRGFGNIPNVFFSSAWAFLDEEVANNYYRPFMHLYYMLAYKLSGLDPWGFHAVNVVLHTLNTVMVFFVASKVAKETRLGESVETGALTNFVAFFAALLFAVNPINTEVVAWVASVPELSATFFLLLSLYFFIKEKRYLSALFFLCALLSKETGVVLLPLLLAFDLVIKREPVLPLKRWFLRYWPYGISVLVYSALRLNAMGGVVPHKSDAKLLSSYEYLLNILPLTAEYLKNLAVPVNLTFYSHVRFEFIDSLFELRSIIYALLFLGALYLLIRLYKRERAICYSIIWIILPLLPVFYLGWVRGVPSYADRYLYISCVGFSFAVALVLRRIVSMTATAGVQKRALVAASVILLFVALLYSIGTVRRALVWQSGLTLWEDTASKAPWIVDARISYANQLLKAGRLEESYNEYSYAVENAELKTDLVEAHNGRGIIFARRGMIEAAIKEFKLALVVMPDFEAARMNLLKAERLKRTGGN